MKSKFLVFLVISAISLFGQNVNIKLIETTDCHGAIYPFSFRDNQPSKFSLAQVYSYVKSERENHNQNVLLLNNGDILQGTPDVYFYNFVNTTSPHLFAEVMNFMKYDVGSVGNHDIETGHSVYDRFRNQINFPWLAANAINETTNEPYFQPYTIFEKENVKIAVLGMITPAIPNWLPKILWENMFFDDMVSTAEKWTKIIEEKENPDLLIGLFHSGVNENGNSNYGEENASNIVAQKVKGFDVVFVGHDHHGWNFKIQNDFGDSVLVIGGTSSARTFATVDILLEKNGNSFSIKNLKGNLVDASQFVADKEFMEKFSPQFDEIKKWVNQPIGEFTKQINSQDALFGESEFVDLIQKIQLDLTNADISFAAPLNMNTSIDSGKIYIRDLFKLYHYENFLYTMQLSGKEIKDILEYSAEKWFNLMKDENDNLLKFEKDENGKLIFSERTNSPKLSGLFYNFESAAGINYVIDVTKPKWEKVKITSLANGELFDFTKIYKVAVNSYRGNGGGGHLTFGAKIPKEELSKRILSSTDRDLRFLMMNWIIEKKVVQPTLFGNWKLVPTEFVRKAAENDKKLMFDK